MKKALKIVLPPVVGVLFIVVASFLLFIILEKYGGSVDFSARTKLEPVIFLIFLFALQWLLICTIPKLLTVFKVLIIVAIVTFLAIGFSCYAWKSSFYYSKLICFGIFTYLFLFYCSGNALTLYLIQRIAATTDLKSLISHLKSN